MDIQVTQRYSKVDLLSVKGRMGKEYYLFYSSFIPLIIFYLFANISGGISLNNIGTIAETSSLVLGLVSAIYTFIIIYLSIQRCHDFDKSGWYAVFALIPFANFIYAIIPNTNGLNRYGEIPKPAPIMITIATYLLMALLIAFTGLSAYNYFI